ALGSGVTLQTQTFNAGPAAVQALFAEGLDASYVGPNPTINAFVRSNGTAIRVISGATSGGASLVVKPSIGSAADLRGKKLASPQLGGTQDVALRYWLEQQGLKTDAQGGGDVSIVPQDNALSLQTFRAGAIDGAWVPEPWATRLVQEGGGKVLVDERDLWPGGRFVTANLVVRTKYLRDHPDVVRRLLVGQVRANDYVNQHPAEAQRSANAEIGTLTGKTLSAAVIAASWKTLAFTDDPLPPTLATAAAHAKEVGLLSSYDLTGLYDLSLLNSVLKDAGEPAVSAG
ncbi:MAG TPA: ABC transporter substrate-binding protein, partial [Candidatus Dormibacteraeota bacterium]|nr:ABC transporter substrate-binding protein [Candidatus Dormibacteraeota bacterium]